MNDLAKIELDNDEYGLGGVDKTTAETGIFVELPEKFNFFGFWSFAFEESFMAEEKLEKLYTHYKKLIGQRVYWTAMAERGNIIQEEDGKTFAYVKLTSLIAQGKPDEKALNLHGDGAGSFKA